MHVVDEDRDADEDETEDDPDDGDVLLLLRVLSSGAIGDRAAFGWCCCINP